MKTIILNLIANKIATQIKLTADSTGLVVYRICQSFSCDMCAQIIQVNYIEYYCGSDGTPIESSCTNKSYQVANIVADETSGVVANPAFTTWENTTLPTGVTLSQAIMSAINATLTSMPITT